MQKIARLVLALLVITISFPAVAEPTAPQGHAHNDYEHVHPLLDAIAQGFTSVEADIWLRDGRLLVGHDEADLDSGRTLQSLYLDPLRVQATSGVNGSVGRAARFTLLIDIKSEAASTYRVLSEVLGGYPDILARVEGGAYVDGAVMAIISGNRPRAVMAAEDPRRAFFDGRLADLEGGLSPDFMPLVSDNWTKQFTWKGAGEMPPEEAQKLSRIVATAHSRGYKLRFWETPDRPGPERAALWQTLAEAGVDYINTDDLAGFAAFVRSFAPALSPAPR